MELFPLGDIKVTPAASAAIETQGTTASVFLDKHQRGEWPEENRADNEWAIRHGHQVWSDFKLDDGTEIHVITAFDRSHTLLLLADEYEDHWVSTREGYAVWSQFYDREKNGLIAVEQPHVDSLLADLPITRALDAGAGTGRHSLRLARRGIHVSAIDQSPEVLAVAQQTASIEGLPIDFRIGRIDEELPLPAHSFDLVICALVLSHDVDLRQAVTEFHRVLVPGGYLLISDWHPDCVTVMGWRTCFQVPGTTYVVPNAGHSRDDYMRAVADSGFEVLRVLDLTLGDVPTGHIPWEISPEEKARNWCLIILARKG